MEAGEKCLNLHIGRNVEHSGNFKKRQKFAIAVLLGHQNGTGKAEKEERRLLRPTGVAREASGAQEFHELQLGHIRKNVEHSGNFKKRKK